MAELTDIRENVREKYAAAARAASEGSSARPDAGCCDPETVVCTPGDRTGMFGGALYDDASRQDVPEAAVSASLGCGVPTAVAVTGSTRGGAADPSGAAIGAPTATPGGRLRSDTGKERRQVLFGPGLRWCSRRSRRSAEHPRSCTGCQPGGGSRGPGRRSFAPVQHFRGRRRLPRGRNGPHRRPRQ